MSETWQERAVKEREWNQSQSERHFASSKMRILDSGKWMVRTAYLTARSEVQTKHNKLRVANFYYF